MSTAEREEGTGGCVAARLQPSPFFFLLKSLEVPQASGDVFFWCCYNSSLPLGFIHFIFFLFAAASNFLHVTVGFLSFCSY